MEIVLSEKAEEHIAYWNETNNTLNIFSLKGHYY